MSAQKLTRDRREQNEIFDICIDERTARKQDVGIAGTTWDYLRGNER